MSARRARSAAGLAARAGACGRAVRGVLLTLTGVTFLFPFYFMVASSLAVPDDVGRLVPSALQLGSYQYVFDRLPIGWNLLNSIVYTGGVILCTVVVGALTGYALARLSFRGAGVILNLAVLSLAIPFQLLMVPLYILVSDLGWTEPGLKNYLALILPTAVNGMAVIIFRQFFRELPRELFDAARVDGASELRILWKIVVPLSRVPFVIVALITFIGPWNDFLWPLLVTKDPEFQPLAQAVGLLGTGSQAISGEVSYWGVVTAASTLLAVPVIALYVLFQREFVRGIAGEGIRG